MGIVPQTTSTSSWLNHIVVSYILLMPRIVIVALAPLFSVGRLRMNRVYMVPASCPTAKPNWSLLHSEVVMSSDDPLTEHRQSWQQVLTSQCLWLLQTSTYLSPTTVR